MLTFGKKIRNLRKKRGESQKQVAAAVGKSRESVAKYEIGKSEPDLEALRKIVRYYGVSADYIIGLSESDHAIILSNPELNAYEEHLYDDTFIPYIGLAAKIRDNDIDLEDVDNFVNNLIKYKKKDKEKTPSH